MKNPFHRNKKKQFIGNEFLRMFPPPSFVFSDLTVFKLFAKKVMIVGISFLSLCLIVCLPLNTSHFSSLFLSIYLTPYLSFSQFLSLTVPHSILITILFISHLYHISSLCLLPSLYIHICNFFTKNHFLTPSELFRALFAFLYLM